MTRSFWNTPVFSGNMPSSDKQYTVNSPAPTIDPSFGNMGDVVPISYEDPGVLYERRMKSLSDAEKKKYDAMMLEQYLNDAAFGAESQITGSMPYYANRLGRGIQSGDAGAILGGSLGTLFQGFKGVMAGAGTQKTQDFLKSEGQQRMRDYMRSGRGIESLSNNASMGYFEDGGDMMADQEQMMAQEQQMQQEMPNQEQQAPSEAEQVIFAYFDANQFTEEDAQNFMEGLQSLAPEEQDAAFQEMAMSLQGQTQPPMQGQMQAQQAPAPQKKQSLMSELFGSAPTNQTAKVMERKKGEFTLMSMEELPITKGEAMEFKKYL